MKKLILLLFVLTYIGFSSQAQAVKNFTLPNLLDNSNFTLEEYKDKKAVVIFFTSTRCPYTRSYKDRITKLAQAYQAKSVAFILINAESANEASDAMRKQAKEYNLPYLFDKGLAITSQLGASKTPETFVLASNLGHFTVKYYGAIDDNPQMASEVSEFYLKDAIDAVLNKTNLNYNTQKPAGCTINQ